MSKIATIKTITPYPEIFKRLRVAAYARVSTDEESQLSSLETQEDYYRSYIQSNPDWLFVGIYADRGITGTSYMKRDEFNRMIADCESGQIDMIVTKSISRFARNTVDTINVVRRLKSIGIGVRFEKENIFSLDGKGEFVLTLMASFAQEEARSLSENTSWGIRKRMEDGKYWVAYSRFLGYGRGFMIEEEGAYTVKLIYKSYIVGYSPCRITRMLNENGYSTPSGGGKWSISVVKSILQNEKYKGDALTQKQFIADFLTKKRVKNNGELPRYYVSEGHAPIIPPDLFDYVQEIIAERSHFRYSGMNLLTSKFRCGKCGAIFGARNIHSTDKYRHVVWRCNNRFRKNEPCKNRQLRDSELEALFSLIFKKLLNAHSSVRNKTIAAVRQIITNDRAEEIEKWIKRIPAEGLPVDIKEWALLIEYITMHESRMVLHLFGGEKINMKI